MKVLITGATGFIGGYLVKACQTDEYFTEIRTISRTFNPLNLRFDKKLTRHYAVDLAVKSEVEKMLAGYQPDVVFHLAADPLTRLNDKEPGRIWLDNVVATQNLLHFCPTGCRFIFASSIVAYGDYLMQGSECMSARERKYYESDNCSPNSAYGATKIASEDLVRIYTEMGRILGTSMRLSATVGVGASHGIIPDLIRKCLESTTTLDVLGSYPGSSKPYVYIDDTIKAFIMMSKPIYGSHQGYNLFNIASDDVADCEVIAKAVLKYYNPKMEINWLGDAANWKGDNRILRVANRHLKDWLWGPRFYTAAEAIEQTVKDYYEIHTRNTNS